jgi:DNA polymerase
MGHVRFQETALSYNVVLDEWEALSAVAAWRQLNHHIVTYWWSCHRALLRVMRAGPGAAEKLGFVTFIRGNRMLLIRLPSGRHLVYRHPRIEQNDGGFDEFTYLGSLGGNWVRLRAWPGKIVENITQAVARDVLVEAMLVLARSNVPLIATIHDELIAETPTDGAETTLAFMLRVMRKTPGWAMGLPVDAAGFIVQRYQKG